MIFIFKLFRDVLKLLSKLLQNKETKMQLLWSASGKLWIFKDFGGKSRFWSSKFALTAKVCMLVN